MISIRHPSRRSDAPSPLLRLPLPGRPSANESNLIGTELQLDRHCSGDILHRRMVSSGLLTTVEPSVCGPPIRECNSTRWMLPDRVATAIRLRLAE
jgi:hypothetical protein